MKDAIEFALFTNVDKETFHTTWDKNLYVIEPGESITQEAGISKKFARELVNKILIRDLPDSEIAIMHDHPRREALMTKILGERKSAKNIEQLLAEISRTKAPEVITEMEKTVETEENIEAAQPVSEVKIPKGKK
jgi:hypothetical protein